MDVERTERTERTVRGRPRPTRLLVGSALVIMSVVVPAHAEDDASKVGNAPTRAEFNKLQAEVRDQRQLIIQMLQAEQQRYDMLLRRIQGQASGAPAPAAAAPSSSAAASPPAAVALPEAAAPDGEAPRETKPARARVAGVVVENRTGFVEGKVTAPGGGDVYVYLDGVRGTPVRGKSIEIRQEGKQFRPRVAVVQAGTSVLFPNYDKIYHNVFSTSPHNSFDLGSYTAEEKPHAVTLTAPGVVEVFCNMHQKMNANILVVPNALYTKVRADGTFRLDNLPVGQRWLTAWSPQAKPVRRRVEVTASGTQISFSLEREEPKAHTNKLGQAYGSYRE